jgi:hypothetical protein
MRTTLDIDSDVLQAAKELAAAKNTTAGSVVSDLLRKALAAKPDGGKVIYRNGFPQFSSEGPIITNEMIEDMLDKDF